MGFKSDHWSWKVIQLHSNLKCFKGLMTLEKKSIELERSILVRKFISKLEKSVEVGHFPLKVSCTIRVF